MTVPRRLFCWFVAATALFLIAGCGPDVTDAPPVPSRTQEALTLLPADAQMTGMLDLQALQRDGGISFSNERGLSLRFLDSDLTFNPLSEAQQARLRAFIEATGFEPGRDLHAAYVALDTTQSRTVLLAVEADRTRLSRHLAETLSERLDTTSHRGTPLLQWRPSDETPELQLALLSDNWIALGASRSTLRSVIDRSMGTPAPDPDDAMRALVDAVGGRGDAWIALRDLPTQRLVSATKDGRANQLAEAVRDAALALRFTEDGVDGTALLTTDQNAADLADVVRGGLSTAKLNQDLSEDQRHLLDQITVVDADEAVWITFTATQEQLVRSLLQFMPSDTDSGFVVAR